MKLLILLFLSALAAGCSNPLGGSGSTVDKGYGGLPQSSPTNIGVISASAQNAVTANGNAMAVSAGSPVGNLQLSTANGNKFYFNIQGQIISK